MFNNQTISCVRISGQYNYCPDIVSEQLEKLESNLTKTVVFHYDGLWVTTMLKGVPFN